MAEAGYGHDAKLGLYKRWLKRGAEVHGALSLQTTKQCEELTGYVDHASEDQDTTLAQVLVAIHEAELAVHTLGITFALGTLALMGALGEDIPDPPPLPNPDMSVPQ